VVVALFGLGLVIGFLSTIRPRPKRESESPGGTVASHVPEADHPAAPQAVPPESPAPVVKKNPDAAADAPAKERADPPVVAAAEPTPAEPLASAGPDPAARVPKVVPKRSPPLTKSPRWDWLIDAPMPVFDRWVEGLRTGGYRPVFVNAHGRAVAQGAPADVRASAIAVKDARKLSFEIGLELEDNWRSQIDKMKARGYQLSSVSNFTDGSSAHVLSLYTEKEFDPGWGVLQSSQFPEPYPALWMRKGHRPFLVAGRPNGDFWRIAYASCFSKGVEWDFRYELNLIQLNTALGEAKSTGFRPESLFVCTGKAAGGFGVVLTRDKPSLLWEVGVPLAATALASEAGRMSALGYRPEQVVGYNLGGESLYLVCWTRDPRHFPATGRYERSLEPVDVALEQFLVERRIPAAAFAVFRKDALVVSRGFGYADRANRDPLPPDAALPLGDLSIPFAAAAVQASLHDRKLEEGAILSELVQRSAGDRGEQSPPSAGGSGESALTIGRLLDGLDPSAPPLSDGQRKALAALAAAGAPSPAKVPAPSDFQLRGAVIGRILGAMSTKPPLELISSKVLRPSKLARVARDAAASGDGGGLIPLVAPAEEVGRFFRKHRFDGRLLDSRARPQNGALVVGGNGAVGLAVRRDDWLIIVLLRTRDDAPEEWRRDLRACVERALDSLVSSRPPRAKPR
jgi:hypothetical protein